MELVNKWLPFRNEIARHTNALILSNRGERMTGQGIIAIVKKFAEEGLGYKISPHKLRAGFCSILFEKTHDIEFVRRAVGHEQVVTTQRYIVTDNKERKEASEIIGSFLKM